MAFSRSNSASVQFMCWYSLCTVTSIWWRFAQQWLHIAGRRGALVDGNRDVIRAFVSCLDVTVAQSAYDDVNQHRSRNPAVIALYPL